MSSLGAKSTLSREEIASLTAKLLDCELVYAPHGGLVTSTVEWLSLEGVIFPWGYSESPEATEELRSFDFEGGDKIAQLYQSAQLDHMTSFVLAAGSRRVFRIDDNRDGRNFGYLVLIGEALQGETSLKERTVYYWFDNKPVVDDPRLLTSFDDVVALMAEPTARLIEEVNPQLSKVDTKSPEAIEAFGDLGGLITM